MAGGDDRRGRGVDLDGVAHVLGVAAGEHDADGRAGRAQAVEHELVAGAQAGLGEREAAEAVALPRVGACEVERDLGRRALERLVERAVQRLQVVGVAGPRGEVDVEVGRDALERVVARAVQGQGECVRVAGEEVGGAVTLVDVAVDHQRTLRETAGAQLRERAGDVVEEAVAACEGAAGVVRAAAEVHRDPGRERVVGRRQRARDGAAAALDQLGRPRQAEPALLAYAQFPVPDAVQQRAVVDALEQRPRDGPALVDLLRRGETQLDDPPAQQRVLGEREAVARGQGEPRAVVSPELHLG